MIHLHIHPMTWDLLKLHESTGPTKPDPQYPKQKRHYPYRCPAEKLTIGFGRNLEDRGISEGEAHFMLVNDVQDAVRYLSDTYTWYLQLSDCRQVVLTDMCFNLGETKFRAFRKMLAALKLGDYERAADEMVDSRWYKQTKTRAKRLVKMMRTNEFPTDVPRVGS